MAKDSTYRYPACELEQLPDNLGCQQTSFTVIASQGECGFQVGSKSLSKENPSDLIRNISKESKIYVSLFAGLQILEHTSESLFIAKNLNLCLG